MLPWSRADTARLTRITLLLAAVLAMGAGSAPLHAQRISRAVLESGPTPVKGIPAYPPNRIEAYRGLYTLEFEEGGEEQSGKPDFPADRRRLEVLVTRRDLFVPAEWTRRSCGIWQLFQVTGYEEFALCYADERGFYLFFFFSGSEEPGFWCAVAGPFIERFLFLLNFVENEAEVPLPAIVQARP